MTSRQGILVGVLVLIVAVLAVGWYTGFSFDISRFFAGQVGVMTVQCGPTQNIISWTPDDRANSNSIQRGNSGPKNLPNCADYWCWLPTIDYPHPAPPTSYTDNQLQPGVCYEYRIKYQPGLPSNSIFCPIGCNATPTPATPTPTPSPSPSPSPSPTAAPPMATLAGICDTPDVTRINLNWTVIGAQSAGVLEKSDNAGAYVGIFQDTAPFTRNSYPDTQVVFGHVYSYRYQVAPGVYSNIITLAPTAASCNAPTPTPTPSPSLSPSPTPSPSPSPSPTASPVMPTVDIKCSAGNNAASDGPCQIQSGGSSTLSWTSANATSCTASGGWSGVKGTQGSQSSGAMTSSQTFVITCSNASGLSATDQVVVNVTGAPTPSPTATPPPLSCAPANQTVTTGQSAGFAAGGGTAPYTWYAQNGSPQNGQGGSFNTTHSAQGAFQVRVTDSQSRTSTCTVTVVATQTTPTSPALDIQKTVRNVTAGGTEGENVTAAPGQTVEFTLRVSSTGTGTATQVTVRDTLPSGLTYSVGSTTVDNVAAPDGVTGSGLSLGDMPAGRAVIVRFRAVLAAASFFPVGTTVLTNTATAQAAGVAASAATNVQNTALISVTRGAPVPAQVPTGPGESAALALIVSVITTLLYVGYTSTEAFRRREATAEAQRSRSDLPDFRR